MKAGYSTVVGGGQPWSAIDGTICLARRVMAIGFGALAVSVPDRSDMGLFDIEG